MKGRSVADTKLLDVASGTGRFLTFARDNFPELQCTALDLSPHYRAGSYFAVPDGGHFAGENLGPTDLLSARILWGWRRATWERLHVCARQLIYFMSHIST